MKIITTILLLLFYKAVIHMIVLLQKKYRYLMMYDGLQTHQNIVFCVNKSIKMLAKFIANLKKFKFRCLYYHGS